MQMQVNNGMVIGANIITDIMFRDSAHNFPNEIFRDFKIRTPVNATYQYIHFAPILSYHIA